MPLERLQPFDREATLQQVRAKLSPSCPLNNRDLPCTTNNVSSVYPHAQVTSMLEGINTSPEGLSEETFRVIPGSLRTSVQSPSAWILAPHSYCKERHAVLSGSVFLAAETALCAGERPGVICHLHRARHVPDKHIGPVRLVWARLPQVLRELPACCRSLL